MSEYGRFSGLPSFTMTENEHGQSIGMAMLRDFWYDDPDGRRWHAPQGSIIDGAGMPQALWGVAGNPLMKDFRRASIVHSVACNRKLTGRPDRHRSEADRMFYFACMADGCTKLRATMLYAGVRLGAKLDDDMAPAITDAFDEILGRDPAHMLDAIEAPYEFTFQPETGSYRIRLVRRKTKDTEREAHLVDLYRKIVDEIPTDTEITLDILDEIVDHYVLLHK